MVIDWTLSNQLTEVDRVQISFINELDELLNTSDVAQDVAYGTQRLSSDFVCLIYTTS
ncbi:hypothetical protein MQA28_25850 [Escherichia coli]|nr:hypothetical protein [Escherichia coli]